MPDHTSEHSTQEQVTVLLTNIESGRVIMPDVMIGEIVDFQATTTETDDVPTWYLGKLIWRDIEVPLISLEALNNDSFFSQSRALKIIVLHGSCYREKMPYWAFVALETPKMLRVTDSEMTTIEGAELGSVEVMRAELLGEEIIVPDVEKIETAIVGQLGL